jgi:hypothetical protein
MFQLGFQPARVQVQAEASSARADRSTAVVGKHWQSQWHPKHWRSQWHSHAILGLVAALIAFGAPAPARAQFLTYRFTGVVRESSSAAVDVGDPVDGTFTYSLHAPDELADPNSARYSYWRLAEGPSPIGMSFTAGSYVGTSSGNSRWEVGNDLPRLSSLLYPECEGQCDALRFDNIWSLYQSNTLALVDRSGTAFDSDASPALLNLGDFSAGELDAWADGHTFLARIDTLELLATQPPLPPRGDFNQNGTVDAADYVVWRKTLGQSGEGLAADVAGPFFGTPNGIVDEHDYNVWRARFGEQSATALTGSFQPMSTSVPEPTAVLLLTIACSPLIFLNRRKCSLVLPKREKLPEKSRNSLGLGNLSGIMAGTAPAAAWNN